jgi:small GTP-binding protein
VPPLDSFDGDDILEQEMLAHLPQAKTEEGLRMLLAQPEAWRNFLATNPSPAQRENVAADKTLEGMLYPAHVAIVGLPNVGKSTLANQLFGQQRSITADVPGTTRDWIGELANIDGLPILLLDTPGLRESEDKIEQSAIALSQGVIAKADLAIIVIDPTQPIEPQIQLAETFPRRIVVLNKIDKDMGGAPMPHCEVATIGTTGTGIDGLRRLIRQKLGWENLDPDTPRCWTERQRELLRGTGFQPVS